MKLRLTQKLKSVIDGLSNELKVIATDLVPWSKEEMELLSYYHLHHKKKGTFVVKETGLVSNIYQEQLFAYVSRFGFFAPRNRLTILKASNFSITYIESPKGTQVLINGEYVGYYDRDFVFSGARRNKPIAKVRFSGDTPIAIYIKDKEAGILNHKEEATNEFVRFFSILDYDSIEEELILFSIAAFIIIRNKRKS